MAKHSQDVFRTSLIGETMAVICGPQGNKFVFGNENKLVASWLPGPVRTMLFPGLDDTGCKELMSASHDVQRKAFGRAALKLCVPAIDAVAREVVGGWGPGSAVEVLPSAGRYTLGACCRVFGDVAEPGRVERLLGYYRLMGEGMMSLPLDLPWSAFWRALEGGRAARREVEEIMRVRRKELKMEGGERERGDVLSKMVNGEKGKDLSDSEIATIFVAMVFAGEFTTSSAITSVIGFLAQLPHVYDRVFKEQTDIAEAKGPGEMLTWEDIEKMEYSWNVARESLRLIPPVQGGYKKALVEFNYGGFTIPKGWKAFWTAHATHNNADYFPEPEKFDPSRFEGRGPPPHTFVPFGGGSSMCPGRDLAKVLMLVFIHNVVTRFRLEKTISTEKIVFSGRAIPAHGLPVRLHPHQK